MARCSVDQQHASSQPWLLLDLPDNCIEHVVELLPANEVACTLRLVTKGTARKLDKPEHITVKIKTYDMELGYVPSIAPSHAVAARWGAPGAARGLTLQQRKGLLCCMARSGGDYSAVSSLAEALGCRVDKEVLTAAAQGGHVGLCTQLLEELLPSLRKGERTSAVVAAAAARGHLEVVQLLAGAGLGVNADRVCCVSRDPMASAAVGGHLHVCKWLAGNGWEPAQADNAFDLAAKQGKWEAAKFIMGLAKGCDLEYSPMYIAYGCSLEALQAVCVEKASVAGCSSADGTGTGASRGAPSVLNSKQQPPQQQQQQDQGARRTAVQQLSEDDRSMLLAYAAASPTPDWQAKAEWVLQQWGAPDPKIMVSAFMCKCDDLPARLEWLEARGVSVDRGQLMSCVGPYATAKSLPLVQQLLSEGWGMGYDSVPGLARRGELELLKALAAAGDKADAWIRKEVVPYAASCGHLHIVRWALCEEGKEEGKEEEEGNVGEGKQRGPPEASGRTSQAKPAEGEGEQQGAAEASGQAKPAGCRAAVREVVRKAMLRNYDAFSWALKSGNWELVRWLRAQGCSWPHGALIKAALNLSEELVEWMLQEGCPVQVREACIRRHRATGCARRDTCAAPTPDRCIHACQPPVRRQGTMGVGV